MGTYRRKLVKVRISAITLCVLSLTLSGATASSADDSENLRSGPYLGLGLGGAIPLIQGETFFVPLSNQASVDNENSFAINVRAGWRLLPFLAAEIQYEWVDEFRMRTRDRTCAKADMQIITGNLRAIAPMGTVQPYLLAGVGASRSHLDVIDVGVAPHNIWTHQKI